MGTSHRPSRWRASQPVRAPSAVTLTPDERRLVVASLAEGRIAILDGATGATQRQITAPMGNGLSLLAVDNRYVLVGADRTWRLDLDTGELTAFEFLTPDGAFPGLGLAKVRFSGDRRVAVAGTYLIRFRDGFPEATGVVPGYDIVGGDHQGTVWVTANCEVLDAGFAVIRVVDQGVPGAVSPDGRFVANALSGDLSVVDMTTRREVRRIAVPGGMAPLDVVQLSSSRLLVLVSTDAGPSDLFEVDPSPDGAWTFLAPNQGTRLVPTPDRRNVATESFHRYDAVTRQLVVAPDHGVDGTLQAAPDGSGWWVTGSATLDLNLAVILRLDPFNHRIDSGRIQPEEF